MKKPPKKTLLTLPQPPEFNVVLQADGHSFMSDVKKKSLNKTEETHLLLNTHAVKCNTLLVLCVFFAKK